MGLEDPVGLCLVAADGSIIDLDEPFAELLSADVGTIEALRGRPFGELLSPAPELPELGSSRSRYVLGGRELELECRRSVAPLGHTVLARAVTKPAPKLDTLQRQLDLIIDSSPLAIVSLDQDRRVVMWSRAAERLFGWTRDEVLGQPYPVVPEHEQETFERLWEQLHRTGEGFSPFEGTRVCKDGSPVALRMHTAAIHDRDGQLVGSMALLEDLTATRALEERVRQSQRMEAVASLAGGIAHDFNNLLAGLIGMAELLDLDEGLGPDGRERVAEILRVAAAARELVGQLMTFGRRQVVRPKIVDLNARLAAGTKLVRHVIDELIELEVELSSEPLWIRIDPTQLDQVLINLAVNASDAMERGGHLRYASGKCELECGPLERREYACIEVADTGAGIPADMLPRIFDPFFTTKSVGAGTGLGLANVYAVVTGAGGQVEVESHDGAGARFILYLPTCEAPARAPAPTRTRDVPRGDERVLLVEDDDVVRRSTSRLLAMLGYDVAVARNGSEALTLFDDGLTVDLVLTDVKMPELGGAELAQRLYTLRPTLPILFMSGNLDVDELRRQVEQGRISFLQKPATLRELAQATRAMLDP